MNNLIILAVLTTTVVVHSEPICKDTYDIDDSKVINQQYVHKVDCTNNIQCENAVNQFTKTSESLTNELLFIIRRSNEEFKLVSY